MSADLARGEQATQLVMKGKEKTEITVCLCKSPKWKHSAMETEGCHLPAGMSQPDGKQNVSRGVRCRNVQREAQKAQVVL